MCIRCGKQSEGHSRLFKDKLIIESPFMGFGERCLYSYQEVKNEYNKYLEEDIEEEEIKNIMKNKFNNLKGKELVKKI